MFCLFASDLAWFLNLVLKSSAVTPMYFTGLLLSAETSAWYTTLFVRHGSTVPLSRVLCVPYVRLSRVFV